MGKAIAFVLTNAMIQRVEEFDGFSLLTNKQFRKTQNFYFVLLFIENSNYKSLNPIDLQTKAAAYEVTEIFIPYLK